MSHPNPADTYGSDINSYPEVSDPGTGERITQGTPVVKSTTNLARDIHGAIAGDDRLTSASHIPTDVSMLALEAMLAIRDPVYWLANAGLTIVLELVEPFNDLLEMVSGDPGEMEHQQEVWGQVSAALKSLSGETGQAVAGNITGWSGKDAEAANEQLEALEASILAASHEAESVQTLLGWSKALAEAIYAVIKSILAELVSWLITRGLMALAASAFTFGASMASYVLSASIKSFQLFTKAMDKFMKCNKIFNAIGKAMMKFLGKSSFRGAAPYALWKGVLIKAGIGIAAGGLPGVKEQATNSAMNAMSTNASFSYGGGVAGGISAHPEEFEATAGALEGLGKNAGDIHGVAQDTAAASMTWGLPGAMGLESAYNESCAGLVESISQAQSAYDGHAARLRQCGENYRRVEEAITAGLKRFEKAIA